MGCSGIWGQRTSKRSILVILFKRSSCSLSYSLQNRLDGHYNHSPMVQWGVQEFEVKGHLRGQFWLYYSNGPAAPSPTVYRIDWMIMKVGHYHHSPMEQWGVQEFEAKGHLEVNFAHFVRTVKLLCLNSQITRGYKFETCQSHCKYC